MDEHPSDPENPNVEVHGSSDGESMVFEPGEMPDYFAAPLKTQHPFGVMYQGEWETPFDGTATAVRKHARALADAGIPVVLKSFSNVVVSSHGVIEPVGTVGVPEESLREINGMNLTSVGAVMPMVKHLVVGSATQLSRLLMRGIAGPADTSEVQVMAQQNAYAATIVYSVWERNYIQEEIVTHLASVGECWVPCEHNRQLLLKAGVERVRVVPHPYDFNEDVCKAAQRRPHPQDVRRFYAIGAWQPRKGFHELLGAFLTHCKPDSGDFLTIKFSGGNWPGYPTPGESLDHWRSDLRVQKNGWTTERIERFVSLIDGRLPRSRIVELHYRNNIYVCSSHGEAWCLPAFDAKLAGNRLIYVAYGGVVDFATDDDIAVPYTFEAVPKTYKWEPQAEWAGFDVDELGERLAGSRPPKRFQFPEGFADRFSKRAVGQQMAAAIIEFTERLYPPAAEYYRAQRGLSPPERAV